MMRPDDTKKKLRAFGLSMGTLFFVIALIALLRRGQLVAQLYLLSGVFVLCAVTAPSGLRATYRGWMAVAHVLAWVNTRVLLIVLFYLVVAPLGLIMRLCGADLLEERIQARTPSYWKKKEQPAFNRGDYERQF